MENVSEVSSGNRSALEDVKSVAWQKSLLEKIPDSTFEDYKAAYEARIATL